jgi:hypothetical protein
MVVVQQTPGLQPVPNAPDPPKPEPKPAPAPEPKVDEKALAQKLAEDQKKSDEARLKHRDDDFTRRVAPLGNGVKQGHEAEGGNVLNAAFMQEVNQYEQIEAERAKRRTGEQNDRITVQIAKQEEQLREQYKTCKAPDWKKKSEKRVKDERLKRLAALDPDSASVTSDKEKIDDDVHDLTMLIKSVNTAEMCDQALKALDAYFKPQR